MNADRAKLVGLTGDDFNAALRRVQAANPAVDVYIIVDITLHAVDPRAQRSVGPDRADSDPLATIAETPPLNMSNPNAVRGIELDRTNGLSPVTTLYTPLFLQAIDAHTGEIIITGTGRFLPIGAGFGPEPAQICDNSLWPESVTTLTAAQQARIEAETMAAIKAVIPVMLDDAVLPMATGYDFDSAPGDALGTGACHRP